VAAAAVRGEFLELFSQTVRGGQRRFRDALLRPAPAAEEPVQTLSIGSNRIAGFKYAPLPWRVQLALRYLQNDAKTQEKPGEIAFRSEEAHGFADCTPWRLRHGKIVWKHGTL
jgi:hypothetical protein